MLLGYAVPSILFKGFLPQAVASVPRSIQNYIMAHIVLAFGFERFHLNIWLTSGFGNLH